ncbi:PKD domain-containing protein [Balamuthia mandrillaris]
MTSATRGLCAFILLLLCLWPSFLTVEARPQSFPHLENTLGPPPEKFPFVYYPPGELARLKRGGHGPIGDNRLLQERSYTENDFDGNQVLSYYHRLRIQPNVISLDMEETVEEVLCLQQDDEKWVVVRGTNRALLSELKEGTKLVFSTVWGCPADEDDKLVLLREVEEMEGPVPMRDGLFEVRFITHPFHSSEIFQEMKLSLRYKPSSDSSEQLTNETTSITRARRATIRKDFSVNYDPLTGRAKEEFDLVGSLLVCTNCFILLETELVLDIDVDWFLFPSVDTFVLKVGGRLTIHSELKAGELQYHETVALGDPVTLFEKKLPFGIAPLVVGLESGWKAVISAGLNIAGTITTVNTLEGSMYVGVSYVDGDFQTILDGPSIHPATSTFYEPAQNPGGYLTIGLGPYFEPYFGDALEYFKASATFFALPYLRIDIGVNVPAEGCPLGYQLSGGLNTSLSLNPFELFGLFDVTLGGFLPLEKTYQVIGPNPLRCELCRGCVDPSFEPPPPPTISSDPYNPLLLVPGAKTRETSLQKDEFHIYFIEADDLPDHYWHQPTRIILVSKQGDADLYLSDPFSYFSRESTKPSGENDVVIIHPNAPSQLEIIPGYIEVYVVAYSDCVYQLIFEVAMVPGYWFQVTGSQHHQVEMQLELYPEEHPVYIFSLEALLGTTVVTPSFGGVSLATMELQGGTSGEGEHRTFISTMSMFCDEGVPCIVELLYPLVNEYWTNSWFFAAPLQTLSKGVLTTHSADDPTAFHVFYFPFSTSPTRMLHLSVSANQAGMDLDVLVAGSLDVPDEEFHDMWSDEVGDESFWVEVADASEFVFSIYLKPGGQTTGSFDVKVDTVDVVNFGSAGRYSVSGAEGSYLYLLPDTTADELRFILRTPDTISVHVFSPPSDVEEHGIPRATSFPLQLDNQTLAFFYRQEDIPQDTLQIYYARHSGFSCEPCSIIIANVFRINYLSLGSNFTVEAKDAHIRHFVVSNDQSLLLSITVQVLSEVPVGMYMNNGTVFAVPSDNQFNATLQTGVEESVTFITDQECNIGILAYEVADYRLIVELYVPEPDSESYETSSSSASSSAESSASATSSSNADDSSSVSSSESSTTSESSSASSGADSSASSSSAPSGFDSQSSNAGSENGSSKGSETNSDSRQEEDGSDSDGVETASASTRSSLLFSFC